MFFLDFFLGYALGENGLSVFLPFPKASNAH